MTDSSVFSPNGEPGSLEPQGTPGTSESLNVILPSKSATAIRQLSNTGAPYARTFDYGPTSFTGGGGVDYQLDPTDTVSADNGGTILVNSTDGGRWKASSLPFYNPRQFGCKGDGKTDDTVAFQNCINAAITAGIEIRIPSGKYLISKTLNFDLSGSTEFTDTRKIDMRGSGIQTCRFEFTGTDACIKVTGGTGSGAIPSQMFQVFSGFAIKGNQVSGSIGFYQDTCQHIFMQDIELTLLDFGLKLLDADFSSFQKIIIHWNNRGLIAEQRSPRLINSTAPNGLDFIGCQIAGNKTYGAAFVKGSCINFYGGDIEGNGIEGDGKGFGLLFQDCGVQGGVGANLNGVYFEQNNGIADVWVSASNAPDATLNPNHCVHNIDSCSFNRVSDKNFTITNIFATFTSSVAGKQKLNVRSSGFKGYGNYAASSGRPYIKFGLDNMNAYNFHAEGNLFQDDIEAIPQQEHFSCVIGLNTKQSITQGVLTDVDFTADIFDPSALHDPTHATYITVPITNRYTVTANANFTANSVGTRLIRVSVNGVEVMNDSKNATGGGNNTYLGLTVELSLNKGDKVSMQVFQDTSTALDLLVSSTRLSFKSASPT